MTKKYDNAISEITHKLNDTLMRSLERLDDDNLMKNNAYGEIERGNAISKTSQTVINVIKTNIKIMDIAEKQNKTIDDIKNELDR